MVMCSIGRRLGSFSEMIEESLRDSSIKRV